MTRSAHWDASQSIGQRTMYTNNCAVGRQAVASSFDQFREAFLRPSRGGSRPPEHPPEQKERLRRP
eukprot:14044854-Alexandrium_andersonii.AAC.1